jgi:hypothetical protein
MDGHGYLLAVSERISDAMWNNTFRDEVTLVNVVLDRFMRNTARCHGSPTHDFLYDRPEDRHVWTIFGFWHAIAAHSVNLRLQSQLPLRIQGHGKYVSHQCAGSGQYAWLLLAIVHQ